MLEGEVSRKVIEKEMEPAQRHRLAFLVCAESVQVPAKDLMANTYFLRIK